MIYIGLYALLKVKPTNIYYDLIILKKGGIYYKDINDHEEKKMVKISNINGALKKITSVKTLLGELD